MLEVEGVEEGEVEENRYELVIELLLAKLPTIVVKLLVELSETSLLVLLVALLVAILVALLVVILRKLIVIVGEELPSRLEEVAVADADWELDEELLAWLVLDVAVPLLCIVAS